MQAQIVALESDLKHIKERLTQTKLTVYSSTSDARKKFVVAADAERNRMYSIWTGEYAAEGKMRYVSVEFLCQGRGIYRGITFFRRSPKIFGIPDYTLIKEVEKKLTDENYG